MKYHLAIIELETHAALLETWYLLLKDLPEFTLCFYVHPKVRSKIETIPEDKLRVVDSLKAIPIKTYDLVIVNTFHRHFNSYKTVFKATKHVVFLHNLNFSSFFKAVSVINLLKAKKYFSYYLKLYSKERVLHSRKAVKATENVAVLSKALFNNLENNLQFSNPLYFNLNFCKGVSFNVSEAIKIVIPGNVSYERKDLNLVFSSISQLNPVSKLHFIFLGKPESKSVLKQLQQLKDLNTNSVKITYFENYVPQTAFNEHIADAHIVFCPVTLKTSFYGVTELYGKTKVSGNENDCIFNGKLGVFPASYPDFNWSVYKYDSKNDLITYFNNLTFEALKIAYQELFTLKKAHTLNTVRQQLKNQLLTLITT